MEALTAAQMLAQFHNTFAPAVRDPALRSRLITEEAQEVSDEILTNDDPDLLAYLALGIAETSQKILNVGISKSLYNGTDHVVPEVDREALAKELADLVYVAYGTALAYNIDLDIALRQVHESNMTKLDDEGKAIIDDNGKILKGPNYVEPLMAPAVRGD